MDMNMHMMQQFVPIQAPILSKNSKKKINKQTKAALKQNQSNINGA
jgi:hypothetical protein